MNIDSDNVSRNYRETHKRFGSMFDHQKRFGYQIPPNQEKPEINGKLFRHMNNMPSKEIVPFKHISRIPQPNSCRTINPELAPPPQRTREKSCNIKLVKDNLFTAYSRNRMKNNNNNNQNTNNNNNHQYNTINNNPQSINDNYSDMNLNFNVYKQNSFRSAYCHQRKRRAIDPSVYNNTFNKENPYKFTKSEAVFSKYGRTTQILNVPGCEKREVSDINDDKCEKYTKTISSKLEKPSYTSKIYKDFRSNVACLPGTGTNNDLNINRPTKNINKNRYVESDVFNFHGNYDPSKYYKTIGRKFNPAQNSFKESTIDANQQNQRTFKRNYKNYSQFVLA